MSVRSGQSVIILFTTRVWSTGVGTNADSLPAGTLYLNGTANGATVTVTNISTGLYKAAVTLPTLAVGDEVEIAIAATVGSVSDTAVIWGDSKDFFAGAIPDAAANANGGLPILSVSGTTLAYTVSTVTTVTNQLTAAAIATGVWQDATSGDFTVSASIGKSLFTNGAVPGAPGGLFIAGTNAATTVTTSFTTTFTGSVTGSVGSVTGAVGSVTGNVGGNVTGSVGSVSAAVTLSAGDSPVVQTGTAQAGSSINITLAAGASGTDDVYKACRVRILSGTGAGQTQTIIGYTGASKVAIVDRGWAIAPDNTSVYAVISADNPALNTSLQVASWELAGSTTVTLAGSQALYPAARADLSPSWWTAPPTAAQNATAVWQDSTAGDFTVSGSPGKILVTQLGGTFTSTSSSVFSVSALANAPGGSGSDPWAVPLPGSYGAGTAGKLLATAGAAADPLLNLVPGSYLSGTAGAALGNLFVSAIAITSPVSANGGTITVVYEDSYTIADGSAIPFADTGNTWPDNCTWALEIRKTKFDPAPLVSLAATVSPSSGSGKHALIELPPAKAALLGPGQLYNAGLVATRIDGDQVTVATFLWVVNWRGSTLVGR